VIVDARSPVLAGMARRARAGFAYRTPAEFAEICELLTDDADLGDRMGRAGAEFVARTYTWPRVIETYVDLFAEVRARLS
jgi:glycosyltransferase involved in cell wall biosynthesis